MHLKEKKQSGFLNDLGIDSATGRHFKLLITKIGHVEPRELNEEFFNQVFPNQGVNTEEDFRQRITDELQKQWDAESLNQMQHSLYHVMVDHTRIDFPQDFLKRWLKTQGEKDQAKTDE